MLPDIPFLGWPQIGALLVLAQRGLEELYSTRYWTHRIVTLEGEPLVKSGPYRHCAHPNYVITITEIGLLPMIFGGWLLGIVLAALYAPILWHKIVLEDRALAPRRSIP